MNCGKCVAKIESSFENSRVKVNLVHGKAYCFGGLDVEQTRKAISDLGFKTYPYLPYQGRVLLNVSTTYFYSKYCTAGQKIYKSQKTHEIK